MELYKLLSQLSFFPATSNGSFYLHDSTSQLYSRSWLHYNHPTLHPPVHPSIPPSLHPSIWKFGSKRQQSKQTSLSRSKAKQEVMSSASALECLAWETWSWGHGS